MKPYISVSLRERIALQARSGLSTFYKFFSFSFVSSGYSGQPENPRFTIPIDIDRLTPRVTRLSSIPPLAGSSRCRRTKAFASDISLLLKNHPANTISGTTDKTLYVSHLIRLYFLILSAIELMEKSGGKICYRSKVYTKMGK